MKSRTIGIVVIALLFLLGALLFFHAYRAKPESVETRRNKEQMAPEKKSPPGDDASVMQYPARPRLFKSTRYPPETPEEKAMWEWWRAMSKIDPNFEWKMPIEFYGKVVDQFGEPVPDAMIVLQWNVVGGTLSEKKTTAEDGTFSISGINGKILGVEILKEGYLRTKDMRRSFEYAAFHEPDFHVPDKSAPVVFRLQKLLGAEPMLKFVRNAEVEVNAAPVWLDVEKGTLGPQGDLRFEVLSSTETSGQRGPSYFIKITGVDGAQMALNSDEFLFTAPEAGYQSELKFERHGESADYSPVQAFQFYVKTRSGKYAAVKGEITIYTGLSTGKAGFHSVNYHNPSGSRNLEFDHRKWINR